MEEKAFTLEFPGVSVAEANRLASELAESLQSVSGAQVEQHRGSENTQDMGASLVLIFGTPAIIAVAKGIQAYLSKRQDAKITIKGPHGEVRAENITSKDALAIATAFKADDPANTAEGH